MEVLVIHIINTGYLKCLKEAQLHKNYHRLSVINYTKRTSYNPPSSKSTSDAPKCHQQEITENKWDFWVRMPEKKEAQDQSCPIPFHFTPPTVHSVRSAIFGGVDFFRGSISRIWFRGYNEPTQSVVESRL